MVDPLEQILNIINSSTCSTDGIETLTNEQLQEMINNYESLVTEIWEIARSRK